MLDVDLASLSGGDGQDHGQNIPQVWTEIHRLGLIDSFKSLKRQPRLPHVILFSVRLVAFVYTIFRRRHSRSSFASA